MAVMLLPLMLLQLYHQHSSVDSSVEGTEELFLDVTMGFRIDTLSQQSSPATLVVPVPSGLYGDVLQCVFC